MLDDMAMNMIEGKGILGYLSEESKKELINELFLIETDELCHVDYLEEYESELEFYLSEVVHDDYIQYLTEYIGITDGDAREIQSELKEMIERKYE